jgi:hypothetical protein
MSLKRAGVTGLSFEGRGERIARGFYVPVLKEFWAVPALRRVIRLLKMGINY